MSGVEAVEAFIAQQRGLLGRLEAFVRTPGFERLCETLRRGGAEGSEAWLAAWLIQPAYGLGQIPLAMIDQPGGVDRINEHLLRALTNPGAC